MVAHSINNQCAEKTITVSLICISSKYRQLLHKVWLPTIQNSPKTVQELAHSVQSAGKGRFSPVIFLKCCCTIQSQYI